MKFPPDSVYEAFKSIYKNFAPEDVQYDEECMSERGEKRKIEFIESYWTGGFYGSDYVWDDNHGELIRCKDCKWYSEKGFCKHPNGGAGNVRPANWFCADGERRDKDA